MKVGRRTIGLFVTLWVTLTSFAVAADKLPPNAAELYKKAFELYDSLPKDEQNAIGNYGAPPYPGQPDVDMDMVLLKTQPIIGLLSLASDLPNCDFQPDWSQGLEMPLPHLSRLRQMARLMSADAAHCRSQGKNAQAAQRYASLMRMASQTPNDQTMISGLVGMAIFSLSDSRVQSMMDDGTLTPEIADQLLGPLQNLKGTDPFQLSESVAAEGKQFGDWLRTNTLDPTMLGLSVEESEALSQSEPMTEERNASIDEYQGLMQRAAAAFANPDSQAARAELASIESALAEGDLVSVAGLMMPAMLKAFDTGERINNMIAERTLLLEKVSRGELTPELMANAAIWYNRALKRIDRLSREEVALLKAASIANPTDSPADSPTAPLTHPAVAPLLADLAETIQTLLDGSRIVNCNFNGVDPSDPNPPRGSSLFHPHGIGMYEAGVILLADARRLFDANEIAAAGRHIVAIYRISRHLADDTTLIASLAAQRIASDARPVVELLLTDKTWTEDDRTEVAQAIDRLSRGGDPFGLRASIDAERERLAHGVIMMEDAQSVAYGELVRTAPANAIPSFLATITWLGAASNRAAATRPETSIHLSSNEPLSPETVKLIERMDGLLDTKHLRQLIGGPNELGAAFLEIFQKLRLNNTPPADPLDSPRIAIAPVSDRPFAPPPDLILVDLQAMIEEAPEVLNRAMVGLEDRLPGYLIDYVRPANAQNTKPASTAPALTE